jgi:hypothetical protein
MPKINRFGQVSYEPGRGPAAPAVTLEAAVLEEELAQDDEKIAELEAEQPAPAEPVADVAPPAASAPPRPPRRMPPPAVPRE